MLPVCLYGSIYIQYYQVHKEDNPRNMLQLVPSNYLKLFKQINELTKFKLSLLNGLVTVASYSLYATPFSCVPLLASSVALSMSTQTLNQYIEIEFDRKMKRTCQRPLVKGYIQPNQALALGAGLGLVGIGGLAYYNTLTALLGVSIWSGYLFLYTKMKSKSQLNTFVGSLVGSLPVYLGWAASGRSMCMIEPFAIFMYMMAWQHQHFYGIRWIYYDDYNNAGFKMEKSKQLASMITIFQTALSIVLVNYAVRYYGFTHCWLLNIPLTLGLFKWGISSTLKFGEGKITAKQMKMESYKHFVLVFAVFIFCKVFGNSETNDVNMKERNQLFLQNDSAYSNCM